MKIIDYFDDNRREHWLAQIRRVEWRAARLLETLLSHGTFHDVLGNGTLYLLTDGDMLVSFLTLTERDCIDAPDLAPWIGFVHTAPEYRGRRCVGQLIERAVHDAAAHGAPQVYICTDHTGLYEKYGFVYMENRISVYGEDSRVLVRRTYRQEVEVEPLDPASFGPESLDDFVRHQVVRECWRNVDGEWQLLPVTFTEDWDSARLRDEAAELRCLNAAGHAVLLARAEGVVVGFAALGDRLGSCGQYIDLLSLHVSEPWRGRGVGRLLFGAICREARAAGAEKLYISAHSSRESQAAYRALGCVHAQEADPGHVSAEPCDVQMEYDLRAVPEARFARPEDVPAWMKLVRRVAWNFPGLETETALHEYEETVRRFICRCEGVCAVEAGRVVGVMLFSRRRNQLCFMAVAPESRRRGAADAMFRLMLTIADPARDLTVNTFCEGDPMGAAARAFYTRQGFVPDECFVEDGYPCQRFIRRA